MPHIQRSVASLACLHRPRWPAHIHSMYNTAWLHWPAHVGLPGLLASASLARSNLCKIYNVAGSPWPVRVGCTDLPIFMPHIQQCGLAGLLASASLASSHRPRWPALISLAGLLIFMQHIQRSVATLACLHRPRWPAHIHAAYAI